MKVTRKAGFAAVLSTVMAATALAITATPAYANSNSLWVKQIGETHGTFGANAAVRIWGDLAFKNSGCPEDGVPDFVYPTSDVYIVVPGTAVGHLVDVTGGSPNTVIQYASVFDDEVIGITAPAGSLGAGEYDVVFDTCQDGVFQAEDDAVFSRVIKIEMPGDLPPPDAALSSLKDSAFEEYESWKTTKRVMDGVWKLAEKALKAGCKAGNPTACALKYGNYFSPIQEQFSGLLLNQGQHYLGIYEDPPNPDFDQPVVPAKAVPGTDALAGEGALLGALLRAVEAYKGAQAAGDGDWALVHARTARDLHEALAAQLAESSAQLASLKALWTPQEADNALVYAENLATRVGRQGLSAAERKTLRESGLTSTQVNQLETDIRTAYTATYGAEDVRAVLDAQIAAHSHTATSVAQGYAAWSAIVDALHGDPSVADVHPVVDAGGPYQAGEGSPVTLTASSETGASYAWDLDGDRDFNDATGATPSVTFATPGSPVIGVRVTDSAGRVGYDWASVTVTQQGANPQVGTATPSGTQLTVRTGSTTGFSVAPSVGAEVTWTVDGAAVGTGNSLSYPAPATPGSHELRAVATDAAGHTASRGWDVLVLRADDDADSWSATTDCDDTDAAVHPGQLEYLGNGVDDDCDAGSPDAPPGGLTGKPFGFGNNTFGQSGTGSSSNPISAPQQTALPDTTVQVALGFRFGFALLADGTVRAFGLNLSGALGDGTTVSPRITPVPVVGVGGQGTLAGVTRVSARNNNAGAVRSDGTVVTWGLNSNGQLGDGSTAGSRSAPGLVLTAADTPLTGVRDVAATTSGFFAIMADGTVKAWGSTNCFGAASIAKPYATTVAGLADIRAISAAGSVVYFLKKDGTVLSCGDTDPVLGRPWVLNTPTSPFLPSPVTGLGRGSGVVDIAAAGDAGVALKEDGTVLMWGQNTNHSLDALGLPAGGATRVPTAVTLPAGAPVVDVIHEDSQNTLAIRADGSMLGWGGNLDGAAGVGTFTPTGVPTVVNIPGRIALSAATSAWDSMVLTRPANDPAVELPAVWVAASVEDASLTEADGGSFAVTLDHPLGDDVALTWALQAGTAGEDDADLRTGTVVVPAGQTRATIPVTVTDDTVDEDDETLTLALTGARLGLTIARAQAAGTIVDNDAAPTVTVDSVRVVEGGTSLTDTAVTFRLSAPSGKEVVAAYQTVDGAAKAGLDYVASSATIRFAPGETVDVVHLGVNGDALVEPDEAFTVSLGEVDNGSAGHGGTVTIDDDEVLTVAVAAPTVVEGGNGEFVVTVTPAPVPGTTVTVAWTLTEPTAGTGDAAGDIVAGSGSLTLTSAQPSAVVPVSAVDDTAVESPEPFALTLGAVSASAGHTVLKGEVGTGWITDNDVANQPPAVVAGPAVSTVEGSPAQLSGTVSDDAAGVSSSWAVAGPCTVAGDGPVATVICADNGTYAATLTAVDADGATVSDTTTLTVTNAAPVLVSVAVDGGGAQVEFTDAGVLDTHSCTINWGDGSAVSVLEGAISPCTLTHTYAAGTYTATVTVRDSDGGVASTTKVVTVASTVWPWRGFFQPIDNAPTTNVVNAGRAIPVKFSLGGYRGMSIFVGGSPSSAVINCCQGTVEELEATETPGASQLTYDATTDTYQYVWKTEKSWAGQCRKLIVKLADGSEHWALFRFK